MVDLGPEFERLTTKIIPKEKASRGGLKMGGYLYGAAKASNVKDYLEGPNREVNGPHKRTRPTEIRGRRIERKLAGGDWENPVKNAIITLPPASPPRNPPASGAFKLAFMLLVEIASPRLWSCGV